MNGTVAVPSRLTQDASAQLAMALGEAVETLKKRRWYSNYGLKSQIIPSLQHK